MTISQRRLADAEAVYRHRGRLVADDFAEIRHLWPDRRGGSFAAGHLDPQLDSLAKAEDRLREQTAVTETAVRQTIVAEDQVRQSRAALTEFETDNAEALRLERTARDIAGRVSVEASAIRDRAGGLATTITQLLL